MDEDFSRQALVSKDAGKQMERSKNGYKPSKIVQKMFADLFVCTSAHAALRIRADLWP